jgi:putative NIF3 family GTP cyclohydrolase 1 type 2
MITRICFLFFALSTIAIAQKSRLTAVQAVERIKKNVGVPWRSETIDTFKAGDSSDVVTGIAVTMMGTLDVLQRAAAAGCNLVITHEPVFYNHYDPTGPLETAHDPVFAAKQAFIREHHLIIWRFHDHWHARKPDGIRRGMVRALGWDEFQDAKNEHVFHLPSTTLNGLATQLKQQLDVHALRVVGSPDATVSTVGLSEGSPGFDENRSVFQLDGVDVLVIGEAHEWETIEYAADAVTAKNRKGMIILGHIPSEQAGMEECARWLKTFINEVPIEFLPAKEPFWLPHGP